MNRFVILILTFILAVSPSLSAKEHVVKLLTSSASGQTMVMEPSYLKISAGDSVKFVPADVTHNVESVSIPAKADKFLSAMGQEFTVTFDEKGVYLYKCTPHFIMGMFGVIQVDEAANLDQVKADWEKIRSTVVLNKEHVDKSLLLVE